MEQIFELAEMRAVNVPCGVFSSVVLGCWDGQNQPFFIHCLDGRSCENHVKTTENDGIYHVFTPGILIIGTFCLKFDATG